MKITKNINKEIFRGYDIRGIYDKDLNEDVSYTIGKAYGTILKNKYNEEKCIVGRDNRLSSDILANSFIQGVLDTGVDVINIGLSTSPMLYYANELYKIRAGVEITASHNPKEYNGYKIAFDKLGEICGDEILEFRDFVLLNNFISGKGKLENIRINEDYVNMQVSKFNFKNRLKVVVDSGNGTASIVVKDIFDKLNVDVTYICCDSDPNFPNHHPDPAESENLVMLQNKVKELNADLGIAFDGDCDRVGIVDENGSILPSDLFIAVMSKYILPNIENKNILFDVSCSKALSDEIRKAGGVPFVYKTGNSYIKRKMIEMNALFGGEISGHTFFKDKFFGFDDGIYAGLRMIEVIDNYGPLSKITDTFNKYFSTKVYKVPCSDKNKALVVEKVKEYCRSMNYNTNEVDGARVEFNDSFAIVRFSNTTPKLTIRFEATTKDRLVSIEKEFMDVVNDLIAKYDN